MLLASAFTSLVLAFSPPAAAAAAYKLTSLLSAAPVGFREMDIPANQGARALHVAIWFPTETDGPKVVVGENKAFYGAEVVKNASVGQGQHPLVIMSHGFGGSWRNQQWLAVDLVAAGFIVASPDHPGTTSFDRDPVEAAKLWERPHDISRVLDALLASSTWKPVIAPASIGMVGHSMGGWTALEIAGARFDLNHLHSECNRFPHMTVCRKFDELLPNSDSTENRQKLSADLRDSRIRAVVSLDLGLARGFTPESLAAITTPVLVFSAGKDIAGIPAKLESGYLTEHMQPASFKYREVPDATHFTFMQNCKQGAAALIESETPGDGIVCSDGGSRSRSDIHKQISGEIIGFLMKRFFR